MVLKRLTDDGLELNIPIVPVARINCRKIDIETLTSVQPQKLLQDNLSDCWCLSNLLELWNITYRNFFPADHNITKLADLFWGQFVQQIAIFSQICT